MQRFGYFTKTVLLDLQVDVTDHIEGHSSYLWATQQVLDKLELDTYYPVYNNILCKQWTPPTFFVVWI